MCVNQMELGDLAERAAEGGLGLAEGTQLIDVIDLETGPLVEPGLHVDQLREFIGELGADLLEQLALPLEPSGVCASRYDAVHL